MLNSIRNERLEAALAYARRGWFVFPAPRGKKKSHASAAFSNGRLWGMTKDEDEIRRYWERWPDANVGIPTGSVNGFFVVETDTKKGGHSDDGREALKRLE
jgi:putative DNA primase/helicase